MAPPGRSSYVGEKLSTRHSQESNASLHRPLRSSLRSRVIGHFLPVVLLTSAVLLLFRSVFISHGRYDASKDLEFVGSSKLKQGVTGEHKVELEAHIMSKCPDAKDCLQKLVVPVMAQVSDKVDFMLSYIGKSVHLAMGMAIC